METIAQKSWINQSMKVIGFFVFMGLVYVSSKKLGNFLLESSSEEHLAKEIILAYQKTIPSGIDTLIAFNKTMNHDTFYIDVTNNTVLIQYNASLLFLSDNGKVIAYKTDAYSNEIFHVFSVTQLNTNDLFESILYQLQQQHLTKKKDYKTLKQLLENEELESL